MSSTRKRARRDPPRSLMKKQTPNHNLDLVVSSDFKGIISSVSTEVVTSKIDELQSNFEKDRQTLATLLSESSMECESILKDESAKFQEIHQKFMNDKALHLQGLKVTVSKFEEDKERLDMRYEQLRKKEKTMISKNDRFCTEKLAQLEESLKKRIRDDKTFSILRKTLGSFLENEASDEDFLADE